MKTSLEREAQRESGEEQPQPTAGAAGRDAVPPPSSELSDVKAWLHARRVMFLRSWKEQQQLKSYGGSIVVGREPGGEQPQSTAGAAGRDAVCTNMVGTLRWYAGAERVMFLWKQQPLKSCGRSIAEYTPAVSRGRGDIQQQLKSYRGRIAVGILAVSSGRGYFKSRGVAVRISR